MELKCRGCCAIKAKTTLTAIPAPPEYQRIRWIGEHNQLLSVLQFCAKTSAPEHPGEKNLELNLGTWLLRCEENRSTEWGPHFLSILLNTLWFRRQSSLSINLLRRSSQTFYVRSYQCSSIEIPNRRQSFKTSNTTSCKWGFALGLP